MAGQDVGIVVVGETPYAEGFGDVGGPECGFCTPAQLEEKSLSLQPGDQAVDRQGVRRRSRRASC